MSKRDTSFRAVVEELALASQGEVWLAPSNDSFGVRMKAVRESLKLEQGEFARRFRLDADKVARLECGMALPDPLMNLVLALIEQYPREVAIVAERLNRDAGDLAN